MALSSGDSAPDFELNDQFGRNTRLSVLLSKAPVMVVFLPLAFSPVCTDEVEKLQQERQRFADRGVELVVISVDSSATLRAWADIGEYDLNFLADFWPHGAVASSYGVLLADKGFAERASFLIDRSGTVRSRIRSSLGSARDFSDYEDALALTALAEWA